MMSFKNIKSKVFFFALGALLIVSCTKDFEEINTNNNSSNSVEPGLLLQQVIYNYGEEMSYEGFVAGNLLGQYFTQIDFNLFDRHSLTETQFGGNPWPIFYKNLRDNEIVLKQSRSNVVHKVYEGPALILKAYMTAALTDIYGDAPYSEALGGFDGNTKPSYDSQEEIYTGTNGILANLDAALLALENYTGAQSLQGDILFNGNLNGWIQFANSLKLKYLTRISDKQNISPQLQAIYSEGNYISTNAHNAVFDFTHGQPNSFRMATLRDGDFNLFILSETSEEVLNRYKDPRINTLYRPIGNDPTDMVFNGLLNGPDASQTSISVADYSLTGTIFRDHTEDLDANFMTAWETYFILAEAAEKGWIAANPKTLYDMGVQLAFDYWGTALPTTYLSTDSAGYGNYGADKIEQIITQKWIANSINGYEGWIEYRRTGFPNLKTISSSLNNDLIPTRMPYPSEEDALNHDQFVSATLENNNSINAKVWWDNN